MSEFLAKAVDIAWGLPLIILLLGGGAYLLFVSRGLSLLGFIHAWKILLGKYDTSSKDKGISHFAALTNALSATVGLGNIAGVAVAIGQGGAGAIFWMWISSLVGMNTKFFECTLSLIYREKDNNGKYFGGPMYVIKNALPKSFYPLAILFTIFAMIGTLSIFNVNQLSHFMNDSFEIPLWLTGVVIALIAFYVLQGGVLRFAKWSSKMVPSMCLIYLVCGLYILTRQWDLVPGVFSSIFREAFTGHAVAGGAVGISIRHVLIIGMKRAAFSNEAGMGTAPLAHSDAKTDEPVAEGLVSMLGPFIDTIVVCTITALIILTNREYISSDASGILMTSQAFIPHFGKFAIPLMGLIIFFFSFSTLLGMANYNKKCFEFFFRKQPEVGHKIFITYYIMTILAGAIWSMKDVVNLLDISGAFMAFPNMISTLILAKKVRVELLKYKEKYKFGPKIFR